MSPFKLRRVADVIRGKRVAEALPQLAFFPQRAADPLLLVLKQAMANASQMGLSGALKISKLEINQGPALKRFRPVSRGQAHSVKKFTSHIVMELQPLEVKSRSVAKSMKKTSSNTVTPSVKTEVASKDTKSNSKQTTKKQTVTKKKTK